jgi:7-cyano-7-deazaguanine synthase
MSRPDAGGEAWFAAVLSQVRRATKEMNEIAVLLSAGLDSAVLAAAEARGGRVHPLYVSCGLSWEAGELAALDRLMAMPVYRSLAPLARLEFPVADLYPPTHWALCGEPPAFDTPDEDVYLTGRNIILLSKAGVYCAQHGIGRLAIGPLAGNPFPDATPQFFDAMAGALSLGLDRPIRIAAPLAQMHKSDVIRLGAELGVPLELTLSCMNPQAGLHCGRCSKCRERQDAFHDAGIDDPASYAVAPAR